MKLYLKYDYNKICNKILSDHLSAKNVKYRNLNYGEVELLERLSPDRTKDLVDALNEYGIEVIENPKSALVQKIKDTILQMVNSNESIHVKASVYLSDKLDHSYGYLSNLFSEMTYTSIEHYIILQKIERAKNLIANSKLTLTEIAYLLNYSSVAHLSTQFKNTTGITPSQFLKIIKKRRSIANDL